MFSPAPCSFALLCSLSQILYTSTRMLFVWMIWEIWVCCSSKQNSQLPKAGHPPLLFTPAFASSTPTAFHGLISNGQIIQNKSPFQQQGCNCQISAFPGAKAVDLEDRGSVLTNGMTRRCTRRAALWFDRENSSRYYAPITLTQLRYVRASRHVT